MIIAIGDVHGKFSKLTDLLERFDDSIEIDFIQLGDFGLGFDGPIKEYRKLKDINYILSNKMHRLWVIRGNHDNPAYWDYKSSLDFSHIKFINDGTVAKINGKTCFFSGGAISIDRVNRIKGASYWMDERYQYDESLVLPDRVDYVFTHDVYHECSPFSITSERTVYWFERDSSLKEDLIKSQENMKKLYDALMSKNQDFSWYHGHYHESRTTINRDQKTYCLAELEIKEVV